MKTHSDSTLGREQPLPTFPRLIFLDTNIVQNLQTFGELIFDNYLEPAMTTKLSARGPRITEDAYALGEIISLGQRAGWPIAISSGTLGELEATTRPGKRAALVVWGRELAYYFASNCDESWDVTTASS